MNQNKEAKSLTFWRGSEVSQAVIKGLATVRVYGSGFSGLAKFRVWCLGSKSRGF